MTAVSDDGSDQLRDKIFAEFLQRRVEIVYIFPVFSGFGGHMRTDDQCAACLPFGKSAVVEFVSDESQMIVRAGVQPIAEGEQRAAFRDQLDVGQKVVVSRDGDDAAERFDLVLARKVPIGPKLFARIPRFGVFQKQSRDPGAVLYASSFGGPRGSIERSQLRFEPVEEGECLVDQPAERVHILIQRKVAAVGVVLSAAPETAGIICRFRKEVVALDLVLQIEFTRDDSVQSEVDLQVGQEVVHQLKVEIVVEVEPIHDVEDADEVVVGRTVVHLIVDLDPIAIAEIDIVEGEHQ